MTVETVATRRVIKTASQGELFTMSAQSGCVEAHQGALFAAIRIYKSIATGRVRIKREKKGLRLAGRGKCAWFELGQKREKAC
jgi:hypothetical protein